MVGTIPNSLFADLAGPPEDRIWTQPVFLNQFHHVLGVQTAAEIGKDVTKVLIEGDEVTCDNVKRYVSRGTSPRPPRPTPVGRLCARHRSPWNAIGLGRVVVALQEGFLNPRVCIGGGARSQRTFIDDHVVARRKEATRWPATATFYASVLREMTAAAASSSLRLGAAERAVLGELVKELGPAARHDTMLTCAREACAPGGARREQRREQRLTFRAAARLRANLGKLKARKMMMMN